MSLAAEIAKQLTQVHWTTEDGRTFTRPVSATPAHTHSAYCSQDVCPGASYVCGSPHGVVEVGGKQRVACRGHSAPTRAAVIRATLLKRLDRGDEFWHYKKSEVEAMR